MEGPEMTDAEYLDDLAERLMRTPALHTDQGDVTRLNEMAARLRLDDGDAEDEDEDDIGVTPEDYEFGD